LENKTPVFPDLLHFKWKVAFTEYNI
jgi:hypothetical protein